MTTESWAEERDRLIKLLRDIDAGRTTHIDQGGLRTLEPTNEKNLRALRARLADLNRRLD